jgi:hypothetical protein
MLKTKGKTVYTTSISLESYRRLIANGYTVVIVSSTSNVFHV